MKVEEGGGFAEQPVIRQGWDCFPETDRLTLSHPCVGILTGGTGRIGLNHAMCHPEEVGFRDSTFALRFGKGVCLTMQIVKEGNCVTFFPVLANAGNEDVVVGDVVLLDVRGDVLPVFSRAIVNGRTMVDRTGPVSLREDGVSNAVLGWTDECGTAAFAAGAIRPDDAWYDFCFSPDGEGSLRFSVVCRLEGTRLVAGSERKLSPVRLYSGHSLSRIMARYAEDVAEQMIPAFHFAVPPSGWCSWYHYYGSDTVDDVRKNMEAIRNLKLQDLLRVIQIDDGWNRPDAEAPRCWGDWMPGWKYPGGMKVLADEIHANGFLAGLWLAPFSVDGGSRLCREHPEWLVKTSRSGGELDPLAVGEVHGLDLTHPGVQEFLHDTFRRVFHEWGFDYVKIDFLTHGALEGGRFDPTKTGIEAFRTGMEIIRKEAGANRFVLNCGSPIAASVGLCDGMRIGMDVGGRWFAPMNLEEWQHGNCCIKAAANSTIWRQWMHRAWWHNDPDCILLRDHPVPEELKKFLVNPLQNRRIDISEFGLKLEEITCWLRLVWMSGGMFILSEDVAQIPAEKWRLLEQIDEPNLQPVCWVDDYCRTDVAVLRTTTDPLMVGIFNLSDAPVDMGFDAWALGLFQTWNFVERLSGEVFSGKGDRIVFPRLPPHAGRIWVLQKET